MNITIIIVIITVVISLMAFRNPALMGNLIFVPYQMRTGKDLYRFLSSGFLHANLAHLAINMLVFWSFGIIVESAYDAIFDNAGPILYILMYLLAVIMSSIPSFVKNRHNPQFASLGASGAVAAVVFTAILFQPWQPVYLFAIIPIPGIIFGVLYLAYSAYAARQQADNINHDAHFWGAIFGVIFTIVAKPKKLTYFIDQLINNGPWN